jgi:hypothetical protein
MRNECQLISTSLSSKEDTRDASDQPSQGHRTRAPEGMSILAFLRISPFLRLPIPLTIYNPKLNIIGRSSIICADMKIGEILGLPALETPPFPLPKAPGEPYCDGQSSVSLQFADPLRQPIPLQCMCNRRTMNVWIWRILPGR